MDIESELKRSYLDDAVTIALSRALICLDESSFFSDVKFPRFRVDFFALFLVRKTALVRKVVECEDSLLPSCGRRIRDPPLGGCMLSSVFLIILAVMGVSFSISTLIRPSV